MRTGTWRLAFSCRLSAPWFAASRTGNTKRTVNSRRLSVVPAQSLPLAKRTIMTKTEVLLEAHRCGEQSCA